MKSFVITEKEEGQRLDKFVSGLLPNAPKSFVYKAFRNKDIRLNGKRAAGSERIAAGDEVLFRFPDVQFQDLQRKAGGSVLPEALPGLTLAECGTVVYEDEDILLFNKKAGILSQKARPEDCSLNEVLLHACGGKQGAFTPSVCNRLDRNTSGLITFAKTYRGARELGTLLKERTAEKYYLAAVLGVPLETACFRETLRKEEDRNFSAVSSGNGIPVETSYERLLTESSGEIRIHLLKVRLITGKTHQIRAHLAYHDLPILGDRKYQSSREELQKEAGILRKRFSIPHQMLHSWQLTIPGKGTFFAEPPKIFTEVFRNLENVFPKR